MEAEEESSPMDPAEAYGHQGERTLEPGQRHALIARYMEEHQAALAVLARFEEAMNAYKTSGYKLDDSINDALREFFAFFDDKLLDHNRREETELFPLLHERMLATGEHSGGSERSTAIDLMEDDHVKFIQLGALVFNLLGLAARLPDLGSRMVHVRNGVRQFPRVDRTAAPTHPSRGPCALPNCTGLDHRRRNGPEHAIMSIAADSLTDRFGRRHTYLRISLTERCNLRCFYCMPAEGIELRPRQHFMRATELLTIARTFTDMGVRKIRLTGGEPLVRSDAAEVILGLGQLPVELAITTNGVLVDRFVDTFRNAGIRSVNISVDTLQPDRMERITRRDHFHRIMANIRLLLDEGFHVKVNMVVMRGVNDDEVTDMVEWTRSEPLHIRFIEFMPFNGNLWGRGQGRIHERDARPTYRALRCRQI
jgi:pyruvate-formate lyase-activating enzyme